MLRKKDCCDCGDWKSMLRQLWEKYQNVVKTVKFNGTTAYPDGEGQITIDYSPDMTGYVMETELNEALEDKQDLLVSGTNIKTINGNSILGSGDIDIEPGTASAWGEITGDIADQTDLQNELNEKQDRLISGTNIKTINGSSILGAGNLVVSGSGGDIDDVKIYYATGSQAPEFFPLDKYQQVEYIHLNGTNYALTDYYPAKGDTIRFKGCVDNGVATDETYFGCFTNPGRVMLNPFNGYYEFFVGNKSSHVSSVIYDIIQDYVVSLGDTSTITIDDVLEGTLTGVSDWTDTDPMTVGKMNGTSQLLNGKIALFEVTRNNETILKMVPVYRKSDNQNGLYDVIGHVFYPCGDSHGSSVAAAWSTEAPSVSESDPNLYQVLYSDGAEVYVSPISVVDRYIPDELPDTTGAQIGDVLSITGSGIDWSTPQTAAAFFTYNTLGELAAKITALRTAGKHYELSLFNPSGQLWSKAFNRSLLTSSDSKDEAFFFKPWFLPTSTSFNGLWYWFAATAFSDLTSTATTITLNKRQTGDTAGSTETINVSQIGVFVYD